ncbi:MAG: AgmX/PglI C-terminal domain-containing protein [Sutterellaceae bacterium]|nr:TonB family protein [Burkholderiaceae bacterium]MCX7901159.1 TonB family protein [Burkholderiaceae bacterium]MDW8428949.1 AgmX/PglI C-terminal domain-containing protein [Sutterellaceae bacterium]
MSAAVSFRTSVLPWAVAAEDERRFRRILLQVLTVCAILGLLIPWIPRPPRDRSAPQELPPQFAKLLLEGKPARPPVANAPATLEQSMAAVKPGAAKSALTKPAPDKAAVPEARNPLPNRAPGEVENARRRASGVGLLAHAAELAEMRGAPAAVQLKQHIKAGPGVGSGIGSGVGAGNDLGVPARALIVANATSGSGGINTSAFSRDTGGGGLAGRATTLVEGVVGGGGGGGYGGGAGASGAGTGAGKGGIVQRGGSGKASRSIEEIRLVFERNKGAIYAIYNRALREDPTLEGKIVLELKIAPSGQVIDLRIVSSELKSPELERKLLARIRQFDFGAKDVETMTVTWPIDFLPS